MTYMVSWQNVEQLQGTETQAHASCLAAELIRLSPFVLMRSGVVHGILRCCCQQLAKSYLLHPWCKPSTYITQTPGLTYTREAVACTQLGLWQFHEHTKGGGGGEGEGEGVAMAKLSTHLHHQYHHCHCHCHCHYLHCLLVSITSGFCVWHHKSKSTVKTHIC